MRKVVGKKSRPHDAENLRGNPGDDEACENANDRRDEEQFLDVARYVAVRSSLTSAV
jgi:hypothetical protein